MRTAISHASNCKVRSASGISPPPVTKALIRCLGKPQRSECMTTNADFWEDTETLYQSPFAFARFRSAGCELASQRGATSTPPTYDVKAKGDWYYLQIANDAKARVALPCLCYLGV